MKTGAKQAVEPPPLSDLDAWKEIVRAGGLDRLRPEAIASLLQAIGPHADQRLVSALVAHFSDEVLKICKWRVPKKRRNRGQDIIDRAHHKLIVAVLTPGSTDGQALCVAFTARVEHRIADADRAERLYAYRNQSFETQLDDEDEEEEIEPPDNMPWDHAEQAAYVERLLSKIPDADKRKAFRLHLLGMAIQPGKGTSSIAQELGVSARTAGEWVRQVQALLKKEIGDSHD
jgi:RNA polymerase sigma factor (sigma-70 family)